MNSLYEKPLTGQTVIITGSARRLGNTIAKKIAALGGDLILHYNKSQNEVQTLLETIKSYGVNGWLIQANLKNEDEIDHFVKKAFSFAPVTILINNASIFSNTGFRETTSEIWSDHLQVNLTAPILLSKSFVENFPPRMNGKIINLVDWRALRPGKDHFSYSISKSALAAFTKALALELAPNIMVNAIALGAILPPENELPNPAIVDKIPLHRWADLHELDNLIEYLVKISPALTGQIIHLDGGRQLIFN